MLNFQLNLPSVFIVVGNVSHDIDLVSVQRVGKCSWNMKCNHASSLTMTSVIKGSMGTSLVIPYLCHSLSRSTLNQSYDLIIYQQFLDYLLI